VRRLLYLAVLLLFVPIYGCGGGGGDATVGQPNPTQVNVVTESGTRQVVITWSRPATIAADSIVEYPRKSCW